MVAEEVVPIKCTQNAVWLLSTQNPPARLSALIQHLLGYRRSSCMYAIA